MVILHQLAGEFDRLGRAVTIIERDEIDLAAVDAALLVDHPEIGCLRPPGHTIGRGITAIRHGLADLDLGIGDTWTVFLLRQRRPREQTSGGANDGMSSGEFHEEVSYSFALLFGG